MALELHATRVTFANERWTLKLKVVLVALLLGCFLAGVIGLAHWVQRAGASRREPLSGREKRVFATAVSLMKTAQHANPFQLNNRLIEGHKLWGVRLKGARFDNTEWINDDVRESRLENIKITNSDFINVRFHRSTLRNVTFENVNFTETASPQSKLFSVVWFDDSRLENVTFIHCTLNGIMFRGMLRSTVNFKHSTLKNVDFNGSRLIGNFQDSTLSGTDFTSLESGSTLSFEHSTLRDTDFSNSHLTALALQSSHLDGEVTFYKTRAMKLTSQDLSLGDSVKMDLEKANLSRETLL